MTAAAGCVGIAGIGVGVAGTLLGAAAGRCWAARTGVGVGWAGATLSLAPGWPAMVRAAGGGWPWERPPSAGSLISARATCGSSVAAAKLCARANPNQAPLKPATASTVNATLRVGWRSFKNPRRWVKRVSIHLSMAWLARWVPQ